MAATDWETFLSPYLKPDQFLMRAEVKGPPNKQKVLIVLDSEAGIGVEDCEAISRQIGDQLDQLPEIKGAYTLEVSSPGADEPLQRPKQLPKHIGRELEILMADGQTVSGELTGIEAGQIELLVEPPRKKGQKKPEAEARQIDFHHTQEIKVKLAF